MKLYTEEQVRKAMADSYIIGTDREDNCLEIEEYIRKNLTPIELPSDKEMDKFLLDNSYEYGYGYRDAIDWIKKQILNQNK